MLIKNRRTIKLQHRNNPNFVVYLFKGSVLVSCFSVSPHKHLHLDILCSHPEQVAVIEKQNQLHFMDQQLHKRPAAALYMMQVLLFSSIIMHERSVWHKREEKKMVKLLFFLKQDVFPLTELICCEFHIFPRGVRKKPAIWVKYNCWQTTATILSIPQTLFDWQASLGYLDCNADRQRSIAQHT